MTKGRVSEPDDQSAEMIHSETQRERKKNKNKHEQILRELWNNNRKFNTYEITIPKVEETGNKEEKILEKVMTKISKVW